MANLYSTLQLLRIFGTQPRSCIPNVKMSLAYILYGKQVHECKQGTMDVTSFFNKLSLIWQEMDLCRELVWSSPSDSVRYSRVAKIVKIYDFLAGLNSKFDIVHGRILGQRSILSLMEVCSEILLEENRTNAMNSSTISAIDSTAFSARSPTSGSEKNNGKPIPVCDHCKKQ